MDSIDNIQKDLKIRHNSDIRLQLGKADGEYNALSAAQTLLPHLGGDQWIESEGQEDCDNKSVGIDMEEDLQLNAVF
jgi:hypothetical protein